MKYVYFLIAVALLSFCNPNSKKSDSGESIISSDSLTDKEAEYLSTESDTLSMNDLDSALLFPDKVVRLKLMPKRTDSKLFLAKHLPSELGMLTNLKTLEIHCLENLEDLPVEIGKLKNLEKLDMDQGNGCQMNVAIPSSIGQLQKLKILILHGAIDPTFPRDSVGIVKKLPEEFANLKNLEVLDLSRNGLTSAPPQLAGLTSLKILKLTYNGISEIPSFISKLKNLQELEISSNGKIKLPNSLSELRNLKVFMGGDYLTLKDQKELKTRFPNITFNFENEFYGPNENETEEKK